MLLHISVFGKTLDIAMILRTSPELDAESHDERRRKICEAPTREATPCIFYRTIPLLRQCQRSITDRCYSVSRGASATSFLGHNAAGQYCTFPVESGRRWCEVVLFFLSIGRAAMV